MPINVTPTPIFGSCFDLADTPLANIPVVATLIGPTLTAGGSVIRELKTYTLANGSWSMNLLPNSIFDVSPINSFYIVKIGGKESYNINVPTITYGAGNNPISLDFLTLIANSTITNRVSRLVGNVSIEGDLIIQGALTVTGTVSYGNLIVEPQIIVGQIPTFFNDIYIIGNLKVTGNLIYLG